MEGSPNNSSTSRITKVTKPKPADKGMDVGVKR